MLIRLSHRLQGLLSRLRKAAISPFGLGLVMCAILAAATPILDSELGLVSAIVILALLLLHVYGIILDILRDRATSAHEPTSSQPAVKKKIDASKGKRITIVVPLYNEERFIRDCLTSVQSQTWKDWQCIVVDDASTDSGPTIAFEFAEHDNRFAVIRHFQNSGLSAARNTGLRLASTELVTFLDSDDLLLSDSLAARLEHYLALSDPSLAGVFCGIWSVPETATATHSPPSRRYVSVIKDSLSAQAECPFNAHAPILRTALVRDVGGFDESMLNGAEDWDCWQRILRHGYYFESIPQIGALYRRKRQSMVRSLSTQHLEEAQRQYEIAQRPFSPVFQDDEVTPFSQPVATYAQSLKMTERVLAFAPMAYISSGIDGLNEALKHVPKHSGSYVERHLNLQTTIEAGTQRAMAIMQAPVDPDLYKQYKETIATVMQFARNSLGELDQSNRVEPTKPKTFSILFYTLDSYEACLAVQQLEYSQAGGRKPDICALVPGTINDAQNAKAILEEAGIEVFSVNRYVLQRPVARAIVCFRDAGFGISDLKSISTLTAAQLALLPAPLGIDPEEQPEGLEALGSISELTNQKDFARQTQRLNDLDARKLFSYPSETIKLEERVRDTPDYEKLAVLKNKHCGQRCVIIGNGPSLNRMELKRIENEISIGVNGIFYKTQETGFKPDYYVVEDSSVMKENIEAIRAYDVPFKIFPTHYRDLHPAGGNVSFFRMNRGFYETTSPNYCSPRFSTDFALRAYCGQSVTYINLQLAFFMGFSEVYLIGMDFDYKIPDSADKRGDIITSNEDDPNHFNPEYFGKGKTWKDPKLDRVLQNYKSAKRVFEAHGRKIYNASKGGKLELFERVDFDEVFTLD